MSDIDDAIRALARAEGKSAEALREELLRDAVKARLGKTVTKRDARQPLDAEFDEDAGPVAPRARRREDETPEEAKERWYEEEQAHLDGAHGFGGLTAGGIFGDGPVATEVYDPLAHQRAAGRAAALGQVEQARALAGLTQVVGHLAERLGLPGLSSGAPPRRRLRGR